MQSHANGVAVVVSICCKSINAALVFFLALVLLSGCAFYEKSSKISTPTPAQGKLPRVTILLSDDLPAYTGITNELVTQLPEAPAIINLQGDPLLGAESLVKVRQSGNKHIVAIGPLAAQTARKYPDGEVIFCQVFNYLDLGLTKSHMRGVSMLPPAELQFRAWKRLNPEMQRVGVITGPDHNAMISEAGKAARKHGIDLVHRTVRSDKEMLYAFKLLTPKVQGLWLLPDDRVLSRRVLHDIMDYSEKHQVQVVVFHPELFQLGGLMSVSSVNSDVAEQVIASLRAGPVRTNPASAGLRPLKEIHIEVNAAHSHKSDQ